MSYSSLVFRFIAKCAAFIARYRKFTVIGIDYSRSFAANYVNCVNLCRYSLLKSISFLVTTVFYNKTTSTNDVYLGKYRHRKDWANTHFAFRCSNAPNYAITTVSNRLPVHHSYGEWTCFLQNWSQIRAVADSHSLTNRPDAQHKNVPSAPLLVWQPPVFWCQNGTSAH